MARFALLARFSFPDISIVKSERILACFRPSDGTATCWSPI